jgi:hypothetical protein
MLELRYDNFESNFIMEDRAVDNDGKEHKLMVFDVTTQPGGRAASPLCGTETGLHYVLILEGHDYYAHTVPAGIEPEYSVTFSVRNGELLVLQEEDFAKAADLMTELLSERVYRSPAIMSLSRWDRERAIELALDRIGD